MIQTSDGRDVASNGTIWVIPSDGTVLRTKFTVSGFGGPRTSANDRRHLRPRRAAQALAAGEDDRAPRGARGSGALAQLGHRPASRCTATATYGEFKRFETSASISGK